MGGIMIFQFPIYGVPVSVHWSTIFLFLIFFLDSLFYLKEVVKGKSNSGYISASFFSMILIVLSILGHEIGHAVVANALGFKMTSAGVTGLYAYVSNGISLSTITPRQEFLIALAGPAANFLLAILGAPVIWLVGRSLFEGSLRYFMIMNIRLGRMNLWPIAVLDGGWILDSITRQAFGTQPWTIFINLSISFLFLTFLFSKKKGRKELESLVDRIP